MRFAELWSDPVTPLAGVFVEKNSSVRQDLGTDTARMMSSNDCLKDSAIGTGSRQADRQVEC